MKRLLLALMVLGNAHALIAQSQAPKAEPPFQAAETVSVTDVSLPILCVVPWGFVVLDVLITETGKAQEVEVRRNIDCLTSLAVQAVEAWKFSPATLADKTVASRIPVVVTFRPPNPLASPLALPELKPQTGAAIQAEFQPAEVLHAALPEYRGNADSAGTVVLEVTLSTKGKAEDVKVLRDFAPFTEEAKAVVGDWRFMPAAFNGRPVQSKVVLAFVSSPPLSPAP